MNRMKPNPWSVAEVETFLSMTAEERFHAEIDSRRNAKAYQMLSENMAQHGYERSPQQCREKFKKMKSDYFKIKKHNAQSADRKTSKWYSQLDAIFGRRTLTSVQRGFSDVMALSSLRLLASPLQLMAASLWGIVQNRAVMHYELLEDIVSAVLEIVPELLTHADRVQLILGLRARVVLEMCQSDDLRNRQNVEPHLKRMDDLINEEDEEETFTSVFGLDFDSALCVLVRTFLTNLEKLIPVPNLDQTSLWLGLSPQVLRECENILNQPDPLSKLIQHHMHGYKILPVQSDDDSVFSSFIEIKIEDTKTKYAQIGKSSNPEEDVTEVRSNPEKDGLMKDMPSIDLTLPLDGSDTDLKDCSTKVAFVFQAGSKEIFSCLVCGQGFASFFEIQRHGISGCSANTYKENTSTPDWRKVDRHLFQTTEANSKQRLPCNKRRAESGLPDALQQTQTSGISEEQICERSSRNKICSLGGRTFTPTVDLTKHMRGHTEDGSHICDHCGEEFDNYESYLSHQKKECKMSSEHSIDVNYREDKSGEQNSVNGSDYSVIKTCNLNTSGSVDKNNDTHLEPNLKVSPKESVNSQTAVKCTLCNKSFSKLIIMRKHYHYTHNVKNHFPCAVCKTTFVRLYDLVRHQENKLLFQCHRCKCCFSSLSELSNHKKQFNNTCTLYVYEVHREKLKEAKRPNFDKTIHSTNQEKPVCSYCDKTFSTHFSLRVHMNRHTGGFSCSICSKVFHQKTFLRRHMDRHNGQEPYLCEICGKGWPTERYLQVHMIKHTDERPFTCDQCGKTFKSKNVLQSHYRRQHAGLKAFKCSVCSKEYVFNRELKLHMMKHTGVFPFACSRCGKGCRRRDHLRSHQKTCH